TAMQSEIAHFDLKTKRNSVNTAKLGLSSGDCFQLRNQPAAHHGLKRIGAYIPTRRAEKQNEDQRGEKQVFPEFAPTRLGAGLAHRACAPGSGNEDSVRISLPERKVCSQALNS